MCKGVENCAFRWYFIVMDVKNYIDIINGGMREKFDNLCSFLLHYNESVNITAITDREGVFEKHFLDSVLGESLFFKGAAVAEVGSGGGFPSIPLKFLRDDLKFDLIESTGKKCVYLQSVVDKFSLDGVKVLNFRAEELGKNQKYREKYDCSTARAVAALNVLCEYCLPFVKVGGRFVAYKGECAQELDEAKNAIKILGGELEDVINYNLPSGDKRTLITIRKISPTPEKYPRGQGKERKKPLL